MKNTYLRWPARAAAAAARLGRALAAVIGECNAAQRRMTAIRTAPDRYTARPDAAPDTYAEFLFRTSGLLLHEPSARARARRHAAVR
jgi:hypothetical protein